MSKVIAYGEGAEDWQKIISEHYPDMQIDVYRVDAKGPYDLEEAEVLIGWRFPPYLLQQLPKLKWIQLITVRANEVVRSPWIGSDVIITNTRGVYADSVAEYVIWAMLTLSRRLQQVLWNQPRRRWRQVTGRGVKGKLLGIIGFGNIGREVALRAKGFGMKVIGVKRHIPSANDLHGADELYPSNNLKDVLGRFDVIALCLPLTDETHGIIDMEAFKAMKPGAILINISSSVLLDKDGLMQALKEERLSGAVLDVFDQEPLSRWSSLWKLDNLIVTPHISGLTSDYRNRVGELICENIRRFRAGQPLLNVVDRGRGY